MKLLMPILLLSAATVSAQQYKTCTISQFKWDDSTDKKTVCIETYNDKGKVVSKNYVNSQSVVDAMEDGDDEGTRVFYHYKDSLLLSEARYRTPEYEDSVLTSYTYNAKGQMTSQVIRRHIKVTAMGDAGGEPKVSWKWISDSISYEYNSKGQLAAQQGGERWHKMIYTATGHRDTAYFSPEELKAKSFFVTVNTYGKDKQVTKKVKDQYVKGKKRFNNTIEYTYTKGKLVKMHSTATSFTKNKADEAKYENMRFDKRLGYDKYGRLQKEETLDPDGSRLQTTLYEYK